MKTAILILLLVCLSSKVTAFDIKSPETIGFNFGTWLENYAQVQDDTNGGVNDHFELTPYFGINAVYSLPYQLEFVHETGYVIQRTSEEISKNLFFFKFDLAYRATEWVRLRAGTSFMMLMISADGGEDTLRNGSGTETYYIPEERRTSYNQTLDFGAEFLYEKISFKLQNYIYAFTNSDQRMTTYSLSVNYNVPFEELF